MVHPTCTFCGWAMHLADAFDIAEWLPLAARLPALRSSAASGTGCVWLCAECPTWRPITERAILDAPRRGRVTA